jgi:hypothetical protein
VIVLLAIVALIVFTGLCLLAAVLCFAADWADAEMEYLARERYRAKVEAARFN